jgi:low temperature requirement protein LtrA
MGWKRLWATPVLAAEWNEEYEEHSAAWWELFVDLLFVVTCSSVAEALEEDLSWDGLVAFVVTFTLFFEGWHHYAAFSSRFIDNSLIHSLELFLFLLATASMVTNTNGFEYIQSFAMSAIWQRIALLLMYITVFIQLPRARPFVLAWTSTMCVTSVLLYTAATAKSATTSQQLAMLVAFWEGVLAIPWIGFVWSCVWRFEFIPLNIDHSAERFSCLVMVVLGESIVSALFDYHRRGLDPADTPKYLQAMALSLSLTFGFGLIYFAVQPPRVEHALRRSRFCGMGYLFGHLLLSTSLLAVGVGVKLAMRSILEDIQNAAPVSRPKNPAPTPVSGLLPMTFSLPVPHPAMMPAPAAWLLFGASSATLACMSA